MTTDIHLPDKEVVPIYGKRWDIEIFFKMSKRHLGLEKNFQTKYFYSQIAHTAIVMVRYMFLAMKQRIQENPRTFGELFRACSANKRDISFMESLNSILGLAVDKLRKADEHSEEVHQSLISEISGSAIDFFCLNGQLCQKS